MRISHGNCCNIVGFAINFEWFVDNFLLLGDYRDLSGSKDRGTHINFYFRYFSILYCEIQIFNSALGCNGDVFLISTDANELGAVRDALEEKGYSFLSAEVAYVPATTSTIDDEENCEKMQKLLDMLEENDDVQAVWHNWESDEDEE